MFTPLLAPIDEKFDRAELRMAHVAPGIVSATICGYGTDEVAARIVEFSTAVYGQGGRYHAFHDWWSLTGYASGARITLMDWGRQRPDARISVLFQSKLVAMGVSVAALALPSLSSFSDRPTFEAVRRRAIADAHISAQGSAHR